MNEISQRVAIITGAASGIGRALARAMHAAGAKVALFDRQVDTVNELSEALGERALPVVVDMSDRAQVRAAVDEVIGAWGQIDYLFNNAGLGTIGPIRDYSDADWDALLHVNVLGASYAIQAVLPQMLKQGSGHLVNTGSFAGLVPTPGAAVYGASKAYLVGLSRALRAELHIDGIGVTTLCPGAVDTPLLQGGKFGRVVGQSEEQALKTATQFGAITADAFAGIVLRAVQKNKALIVLPRPWRFMWWLERMFPGSVVGTAMRRHFESTYGRWSA